MRLSSDERCSLAGRQNDSRSSRAFINHACERENFLLRNGYYYESKHFARESIIYCFNRRALPLLSKEKSLDFVRLTGVIKLALGRLIRRGLLMR